MTQPGNFVLNVNSEKTIEKTSEKTSEKTLEKTISVLNFIGNIPKNHKPCYNSLTTVDKNSWFVTWKRRWNGEKGEKGIKYILKVLDSCDLYYRMCVNNWRCCNVELLQQLSQSLKDSVKGFDNLIETYSDQGNVKQDYIKCKETSIFLYTNINNIINIIVSNRDKKSGNFFKYA